MVAATAQRPRISASFLQHFLRSFLHDGAHLFELASIFCYSAKGGVSDITSAFSQHDWAGGRPAPIASVLNRAVHDDDLERQRARLGGVPPPQLADRLLDRRELVDASWTCQLLVKYIVVFCLAIASKQVAVRLTPARKRGCFHLDVDLKEGAERPANSRRWWETVSRMGPPRPSDWFATVGTPRGHPRTAAVADLLNTIWHRTRSLDAKAIPLFDRFFSSWDTLYYFALPAVWVLKSLSGVSIHATARRDRRLRIRVAMPLYVDSP